MQRSPGVPMQVPDINAMRAQQQAIDAQKEIANIQFAQNIRLTKAKIALEFVNASGESQKASVEAAHHWLKGFFSVDSEFEAGVPIHENILAGVATR